MEEVRKLIHLIRYSVQEHAGTGDVLSLQMIERGTDIAKIFSELWDCYITDYELCYRSESQKREINI